MRKDEQPYQQSEFKNSLKNLTGTTVYFFCQWLTLVIVINIAGYAVSGEYMLVISFTNLFGFISLYNLRSFQLSDVGHRYTPQQYTGAYVITAGAALVCFFAILPFSGYSLSVILGCLVYIVYKLNETFSAYTFTYMQMENRFSKIAVSHCLKGIIPLAGFSLCLYFAQSLWLALLVMSFLFFLILVFYDLNILRHTFPRGISFRGTSHILRQCFPMMLSTLTAPFMLFLTRHAIEMIFGTEKLGYYSAFTMVIVVLATMTGSVFVVLLPGISRKIAARQKSHIVRSVFILTGILFAVTLLAIFLAGLIGDLAFSFIFGAEILPFMYLLPPAIIAGALLTLMGFLTTCLIAMHLRVSMLLSKLAGAVLLVFLAFPVTERYGLLGITNALSLSFGLTIVLQGIIIFYSLAFSITSNDKSM